MDKGIIIVNDTRLAGRLLRARQAGKEDYISAALSRKSHTRGGRGGLKAGRYSSTFPPPKSFQSGIVVPFVYF